MENGIKEMDWVKTKHQKPEGMNRAPLIPPGKREYRELMLMCQYQRKNQEVKEIEIGYPPFASKATEGKQVLGIGYSIMGIGLLGLPESLG